MVKICIDGNYSEPVELQFSIPQGSCSGANLFCCCCSLITSCIPPQLNINGFPDDHLIRQQHKPTCEISLQVRATMQTTLTSIKYWMDSMHLKLNTDKTDFIIFSSKCQLRKLDKSPLDANGSLIPKSEVVRYLGGLLDTSLTFETHVKTKVKTAMANFTKIRSIWDYLSIRACTILIIMLCITHIDYANAILFRSTAKVINKFQSLQNMCTKLILRRSKYSSSMESLYKLCWLPVRQSWLPVHQRIDYKILTLTHKCLQEQTSKCLQDLINIK